MGNIFIDDFRDFIQALNDHDVDYMLVGGYAVLLHGVSRTTGDMDIWVHKTKDNYKKLMRSYTAFGLPTSDLSEQRFLGSESDVFSYGISPVTIDIITELKGMEFNSTYQHVQIYNDDDLTIKYINLRDLIEAKKASGRYKDLDDIEKLSLL